MPLTLEELDSGSDPESPGPAVPGDLREVRWAMHEVDALLNVAHRRSLDASALALMLEPDSLQLGVRLSEVEFAVKDLLTAVKRAGAEAAKARRAR